MSGVARHRVDTISVPFLSFVRSGLEVRNFSGRATIAHMVQRDVGLILMRQLASGLAVPTLIADESGDLLYFNEAAEVVLGQRFDELGDMPLDRRRRILAFRDEQGHPLPDDQPPLVVALHERRPVHRRVWMRGFDGQDRAIEVTAFPLLGGGGHLIGAVAMFWERKQP